MSQLIDPSPRPLGNNLSVGPIGFGTWRLVAMPADAAQARLEAALDSGMNLIDTADVYGLDWGGDGFGASETLIGQVLAQAPQLRERMVLATKGGIIPGIPYDSAYLQQACEDSLRRLQVEQVDLYQIHRPDMLTHPQETARVLEDLRSSGKVREVGVSNYLPSQTAALMAHLPFALASVQPEYSALHLDPLFDGSFDQCMQHNLSVLAWSPLAGGKLAGDELADADVPAALASALAELAKREQTDIATIALAFVLAHPCKPVALWGSTQISRIEAAQKALDVKLNRQDVYTIIQASMGEALP